MLTEQSLERIAIALEALSPSKLGLKSDSIRKYLYVGKEQNTCWYFRKDEQNIPVIETSLVGTVTRIEIVEKEFKNEKNLKLQISVDADIRYCVQSGLETSFSHGFLQAFGLLTTNQMRQVVTIAVRPGEEKTVFCNLYQDGQKIQIEWDKNIDLHRLARDISARMTGINLAYPELINEPIVETILAEAIDRENLPIPMNAYRKTLFTAIDRQMGLLEWSSIRAQEYLKNNYDGKISRYQLTDEELNRFSRSLEKLVGNQ